MPIRREGKFDIGVRDCLARLQSTSTGLGLGAGLRLSRNWAVASSEIWRSIHTSFRCSQRMIDEHSETSAIFGKVK
jgi:hypothetical protein